MKLVCGLLLVSVILSISDSASLVRNKRFFNWLWPSEVKEDVQTGFTYAQLPTRYLNLLPGVNDQFQKRSDTQQPFSANPPARFVHPTRMTILMQPRLQQVANQLQQNGQAPQLQQQLGPRIFMKPVGPATKLRPSIVLKTKEQSLPDIHKLQRFVSPKPVQAQKTQGDYLFNTQQTLPIKKSSDSPPLPSIKDTPMKNFYYTQEFEDILRKYNINVDIKKLPPIEDVMVILGTENGQETLDAINEVVTSSEGKALIKDYLNSHEGEFYNYDDDVGAGEIKIDGSGLAQNVQPSLTPVTSAPRSYVTLPQTSQTQILRATTEGTLTGDEGRSWWNPTTWFSSASSTKVESVKTDAEILNKVVGPSGVDSGSGWQNLQYLGRFFTSGSSESVPINPPFNVDPRRVFVQYPFGQQNNEGNVLPTVRMTEAQFQDMVKVLRFTPVHKQNIQQKEIVQEAAVKLTTVKPPKSPLLKEVTISPVKPTEITPIIPMKVPKIVTEAPLDTKKFQTPINVQPANRNVVPLPSTFSRGHQQPENNFESDNKLQENRRNFIPLSDPQRSAPFDFIAAGEVHQANPEEVSKRSRSLADAVEGKMTKF